MTDCFEWNMSLVRVQFCIRVFFRFWSVCLSVLTMSFPALCADCAHPPGILTCHIAPLCLPKQNGTDCGLSNHCSSMTHISLDSHANACKGADRNEILCQDGSRHLRSFLQGDTILPTVWDGTREWCITCHLADNSDLPSFSINGNGSNHNDLPGSLERCVWWMKCGFIHWWHVPQVQWCTYDRTNVLQTVDQAWTGIGTNLGTNPLQFWWSTWTTKMLLVLTALAVGQGPTSTCYKHWNSRDYSPDIRPHPSVHGDPPWRGMGCASHPRCSSCPRWKLQEGGHSF